MSSGGWDLSVCIRGMPIKSIDVAVPASSQKKKPGKKSGMRSGQELDVHTGWGKIPGKAPFSSFLWEFGEGWSCLIPHLLPGKNPVGLDYSQIRPQLQALGKKRKIGKIIPNEI